jgi:hypothetical protein
MAFGGQLSAVSFQLLKEGGKHSLRLLGVVDQQG